MGIPALEESRVSRSFRRRGAALALTALGGLAPGPAVSIQAPESHLVVIGGLGGDPAHRDAFHATALRMLDAAEERMGLSRRNLVYLAEDPERAPGRIVARSTAENVARALREIAARAGPSDNVLLLLIGHGSARGEDAAINLPGPDMTGSDLAALLDAFPTQTIAVINTTSASGGFVAALSGPRRIVVTATRPRERNEARFAGYFVGAYSDDVADVDKDGRVSVLEAFEYARREVRRLYESENRLLTEHPLLDDDGDGQGSLAPETGAGDGSLARRFFLAPSRGEVAAAVSADPQLGVLYERKRDLEGRIEALRDRKAEMDSIRYETELEELLVDLAVTTRSIREREGTVERRP